MTLTGDDVRRIRERIGEFRSSPGVSVRPWLGARPLSEECGPRRRDWEELGRAVPPA